MESFENKNLPAINETISEGYDLEKTEKKYKLTAPVFEIFGRKYYKAPFKSINENIIVSGGKQEISFDIRVVHIEARKIIIDTYFNENNLNILTNRFNALMAHVCPKYEHFINYSSNQEIYISSELEAVEVSCQQIDIKHLYAIKNKVIKEFTVNPN